MASADFTVNGSTTPPEIAVAASSTVTLALVSTTGVRLVEWSVEGNHSSAAVNPTITPAGSPNGATATFTMPSGTAQGYLIQCRINGGVDETGQEVSNYTKRAIVGVLNTANVVPFVTGETFERSATHGYTEVLNDVVESGGGGLIVSGTPSTGYAVKWNGSQAVWTSLTVFDITAFAVGTATVEVGQGVVNPSFTSAQNLTPTSLTLTNNSDAESKSVVGTPTSFASSHTFTKNTVNASVIFTLSGSNGIDSDTANATITWKQKIFWGVSTTPANTEAFVEGLASNELNTNFSKTFTVNASGSNKIYFAHRTSAGTPNFAVGGFSGGFTLRSSSISVTNAQGFAENYSLWESDVAGLGSTTVTVS